MRVKVAAKQQFILTKEIENEECWKSRRERFDGVVNGREDWEKEWRLSEAKWEFGEYDTLNSERRINDCKHEHSLKREREKKKKSEKRKVYSDCTMLDARCTQ